MIIRKFVCPDGILIMTCKRGSINVLEGFAEATKLPSETGFYYNRIFVKPKSRKKGYGNKLLKALLNEINKKKTTLSWEVNSFGDMTSEQLEEWYLKNGFTKESNYLVYNGGLNGKNKNV